MCADRTIVNPVQVHSPLSTSFGTRVEEGATDVAACGNQMATIAKQHQRSIVVVLAGWLGCQTKALQKYERLYQRLLTGRGNDRSTTTATTTAPATIIVLPRIAPPHWIVQTCMGQTEQMDEMARQLIRDVREHIKPEVATGIDSPIIAPCELYFHAFSNGGCILWDRFRHELLLLRNESENNNKADNELVLSSINGVIFDSCPIAELSLIQEALQHCTWRERAQVVRECGGLAYLRAENLKVFSETFQTALRLDPLPIPQLYLYSRNDPLTPYEFIHELIEFRRRRQQQQSPPLTSSRNDVIINAHCWDESAHCAHMLLHPETYEKVVEDFLQQTRRSTTTIAPGQSKL
jgi:Eukaryotic protein of unknown function (DUF829)